MSLTSTTAAEVVYGSAHGILSAMWLLVAIPLGSAAILLLLGRRANRWGHWLGVLSVLAAFVIGVVVFLQPEGPAVGRA